MFELIFSRHTQARMGEACAAAGVSRGLLKTLIHLEPGVGVPMRDLADHWGCDASYVTSMTDALEERGLAERLPHPSDRRIKMIALTDEGVLARNRAFDLLYDPPASFRALTGAEQRELRDLLRKVIAADPELAHDQATRHPGTRIRAAAGR
jgi:MarR family transcriptional regulator, organic hydroperoxide resistance regulator